MTPLFTGIYDKFLGTALAIQISNKLYLDEASQGASMPYVVFSLISGTTDWVICPDGDMNFDECIVQFNLFSDKLREADEVGTMYTNLKALYDWGTLAVAGFTHLYMRREFFHLMRDIDEKTWQYVVQYRILLEY